MKRKRFSDIVLSEEKIKESRRLDFECGQVELYEFLDYMNREHNGFDGHFLTYAIEIGEFLSCDFFDGKSGSDFVTYVKSGAYDREREQADARWLKIHEELKPLAEQYAKKMEELYRKNHMHMTREEALQLADELENGTFQGYLPSGWPSKSEFIHYLRTQVGNHEMDPQEEI